MLVSRSAATAMNRITKITIVQAKVHLSARAARQSAAGSERAVLDVTPPGSGMSSDIQPCYRNALTPVSACPITSR
jgi:hypothetical protein